MTKDPTPPDAEDATGNAASTAELPAGVYQTRPLGSPIAPAHESAETAQTMGSPTDKPAAEDAKPAEPKGKKEFDPWHLGWHTVSPELRRELLAAEIPRLPADRLYGFDESKKGVAHAEDASDAKDGSKVKAASEPKPAAEVKVAALPKPAAETAPEPAVILQAQPEGGAAGPVAESGNAADSSSPPPLATTAAQEDRSATTVPGMRAARQRTMKIRIAFVVVGVAILVVAGLLGRSKSDADEDRGAEPPEVNRPEASAAPRITEAVLTTARSTEPAPPPRPADIAEKRPEAAVPPETGPRTKTRPISLPHRSPESHEKPAPRLAPVSSGPRVTPENTENGPWFKVRD
jgi:hypothetical protein